MGEVAVCRFPSDPDLENFVDRLWRVTSAEFSADTARREVAFYQQVALDVELAAERHHGVWVKK